MKLSAGIVDDEKNNVDALASLIERYASDIIKVEFTSITYADAKDKINTIQPKILFLDIQLDYLTAFDLLKDIIPYNYIVIFVSAYYEYSLDSFKFNTAYFILKPLSVEKLNLAINLAWRKFHTQNYTKQSEISEIIKKVNNINSSVSLAVPEISSINLVDFDKIVYCKSDGRYTDIYLNDEKIITSAKNIGKYSEILPSAKFFRIHKSYIVNLDMVEAIGFFSGSYCKLKNGMILPISKRRSSEFVNSISIK